MLYFISTTRNRILNTNLDYMGMLNENGTDYLQKCLDNVNKLNNELFQSQSMLEDVFHYLKDSEETYQKYRLDSFMQTNSFQYMGLDYFITNAFEGNVDIKTIRLISYERKEVTVFSDSSTNHRLELSDDEMKQMTESFKNEYGSFSFQKELRNPKNMQSAGMLIITFRADKLVKIYNSIAELLLQDMDGTILYASDESIIKDNNTLDESQFQRTNYTAEENVQQYQLIAYIPMGDAADIPLPVFLTILLIGTTLILLGTVSIHFYLNRLNGRLNYILDGMNAVTTGDMKVRLQHQGGGDELDVISEKFNDMCEKLERYIQQSYLAEIEQKNAEMEVLQNQINPHFLYNTLEAIRMKAICNGDREVGKMLYSMAVIYRSQLKDADMITLIQEIHYCKKYLELFEFRYPGKFSFHIECEEALMNIPVMKFILQPIMENYFIHGIKPEQEGNHISVLVEVKDDCLWIHVSDNGQGMTEQQLLQKNEELEQNSTDSKRSVGLANVNRRLKAVYGLEYGIRLQHGETGGLHVILKAGLKGRDDYEKSTVSRG